MSCDQSPHSEIPAQNGFANDDVNNIISISTDHDNDMDILNFHDSGAQYLYSNSCGHAYTDGCSSSPNYVHSNNDVHSNTSSVIHTTDVATNSLVYVYPTHHSDFLMNCNPVSVSQPVIVKVKHMISTLWPTVTAQAKETCPELARAYDAVKSTNLPNFMVAKVPVPSGLVVKNWVQLLSHYHDNEICNFLYYGWPIGYLSDKIPESVTHNHPSALAYLDHVDDFIATELGFGAIAGPINDAPFTPWVRISPLMTRPKKGSETRRIIVDLTYPEGLAVNSGNQISDYLGRDITYSLPTVLDLIARLQDEGQGAFIWKADLARAYRQLRADPVDAALLGMMHRGKRYIVVP